MTSPRELSRKLSFTMFCSGSVRTNSRMPWEPSVSSMLFKTADRLEPSLSSFSLKRAGVRSWVNTAWSWVVAIRGLVPPRLKLLSETESSGPPFAASCSTRQQKCSSCRESSSRVIRDCISMRIANSRWRSSMLAPSLSSSVPGAGANPSVEPFEEVAPPRGVRVDQYGQRCKSERLGCPVALDPPNRNSPRMVEAQQSRESRAEATGTSSTRRRPGARGDGSAPCTPSPESRRRRGRGRGARAPTAARARAA